MHCNTLQHTATYCSALNYTTSQVLASRTPKNIQKRKRAANNNLPMGAARYVPTSPEFMAVLEQRADKAADKNAKAAAKQAAAAKKKEQQPPRKKKK